MAVAGFGAVSRVSFPFRRSLALCARRRSSSAPTSTVETLADLDSLVGDGTASSPPSPPPPKPNAGKGSDGIREWEWKVLSSKELGIKASRLPKPTRIVLNGLKKKGYDAYLVGGCVRDLLMKRVPKDYDVITTADLNDVKRTFSHCDIVGKRFPICHVHVSDCIVEVSSFNTHARRQRNDLSYLPRRSDCDEHDYARWKNCLRRDFTINGLMFNPFSKIVYDYLGGMEDIRKAKVRTVKPAHLSFHEDCARILRAIRIAARLGFSFSKETAYSVKDLANSVLRLDKGRILMEMNYMLAYGSAENSLRLLWRFGILELLLPIQDIFATLDKLLAPNRPCHNSLWVGILAFHQALVRQPRDPSVIATYCLALHNGGNLPEAVDIARSITRSHDNKFPELLKSREWDDGDLICEVRNLASSVTSALSSMTDEHFVSQAMAPYPQAPYSDLVFIPLQLYLSVGRIFECVNNRQLERGYIAKKGNKINYCSLAEGGLAEIRHVFARVVFDTIFPPNSEGEVRINPV
ncbi:poly(A) polymerase I-like isoform X3 [Zingiber officinale]|uniref:poly(A) polymerase I-like isoform X3 n=1 Tax=Zingiber officinale TaxID=94328 RepID=UPI001C4D1F18|nr:poly(A) polymerase I-like isoform X3 [Zingiber officinale]